MDTFAAKKAVRPARHEASLPAARRRPIRQVVGAGGEPPQQVEGAAVPAKRSPSQVTTSGADAVRTPKWSTPS